MPPRAQAFKPPASLGAFMPTINPTSVDRLGEMPTGASQIGNDDRELLDGLAP